MTENEYLTDEEREEKYHYADNEPEQHAYQKWKDMEMEKSFSGLRGHIGRVIKILQEEEKNE